MYFSTQAALIAFNQKLFREINDNIYYVLQERYFDIYFPNNFIAFHTETFFFLFQS